MVYILKYGDSMRKVKNKSRSSNFELLRIIAMLMIVAHHFSIHSGFSMKIPPLYLNTLFLQFLQFGGKIGVNVFVLISGYFLINTDNIKLKKVIKLWCQIFFYSFIIYLIFTLTGYQKFNITSFIKSIMPIIYSQYWFASSYFILYLFVPYINKLVKNIEKVSYKKLLVLMFVLWSILPTLTKQKLYMNEILWFLFLYLVAGYIRLYFNDTRKTCKWYFINTILVFILTFSITIIMDLLSLKYPYFNKYTTYLYGMNQIPILIISILLFLTFKNLKLRNIKVINTIASATFGVYLIHDNPIMRVFLWKTLFKNASFQFSLSLIPYAIMCIVIVYIVSTIIELLRIHLLEKYWLKGYDKMEDQVNSLKYRLYKKLGLLAQE